MDNEISCDKESTNEIADEGSPPLGDSSSSNSIISDAEHISDKVGTADETSSDDSTNQISDGHLSTAHMIWMSQGTWHIPPYSYRQDNERVVFVFHSRETKSRSLVNYFDEHMVREGGREGRRKRGREGRRKRGREGRREGGKEKEREGEGGREGGK